MYVGQWCVCQLDTLQSEESGQLNIGTECKVDEVECCLRASQSGLSLGGGSPDVFWYGKKGALEIVQYSFRKDHIVSSMVWVGISVCGPTVLHITWNDNLMAQRYTNQILRPHVVTYAAAIGDSFLLMQHNARNHNSSSCRDFS
ncbi:hypothetical protein TNCV_388421 [Trichonephila clavipes]|nr:hypothetical protein TNCV_388421 [Trichonephila clavipes]